MGLFSNLGWPLWMFSANKSLSLVSHTLQRGLAHAGTKAKTNMEEFVVSKVSSIPSEVPTGEFTCRNVARILQSHLHHL